MIVSVIIPYLRSTSNLALSCRILIVWLRANGFPIRTSEGELCLENVSFYKALNLSGVDQWMNAQLFRAIRDDKVDTLKTLLQGGADPEAMNSVGHTALTFSILTLDRVILPSNRIDCLKLLLEHKADPGAIDSWRWTPLICAALHGNVECIKILLEHKADIEAQNYYGDSPLTCAAKNDEVECIETLLEHGAQVTPQIRADYPEYEEWWEDSSL